MPASSASEAAMAISLVDSHCHIVFRNFDADLDAVAQRWRDAGVKALVHACVEPSEIPAIRALADRFPEMRYSVGVHPLDTQHWAADTQQVLRDAAKADSRVVAIGELGLDLFRDKNLDEQLAVLGPQLDLAIELDLPVIIHCRDAAEPMLAELRRRAAEGTCPRGVMHCWGGTPDEMAGFLELGFYISFSGVVTFPKAEDTHTCARQVPADPETRPGECRRHEQPSPARGTAARTARSSTDSLQGFRRRQQGSGTASRPMKHHTV